MQRLPWTLILTAGAVLAGCSSTTDEYGSGQFQVDVWADNWFSLAVGEETVGEDSVPITTERSFNKESFAFDGSYPLVLNFTVKDYMENDTGLEYIGTEQQQMGDGGFIAQVTDTSTGSVVAVTSSAFRCLVIHKAPLNTDCEKSSDPEADCQSQIDDEPEGWKSADYDTSAWPSAVEYSEEQVGTKEGYDEVSWDSSAKLIWSSSLEQDNILLCKLVVEAP